VPGTADGCPGGVINSSACCDGGVGCASAGGDLCETGGGDMTDGGSENWCDGSEKIFVGGGVGRGSGSFSVDNVLQPALDTPDSRDRQ
jgi:hypothetical protein